MTENAQFDPEDAMVTMMGYLKAICAGIEHAEEHGVRPEQIMVEAGACVESVDSEVSLLALSRMASAAMEDAMDRAIHHHMSVIASPVETPK